MVIVGAQEVVKFPRAADGPLKMELDLAQWKFSDCVIAS